MARLWPLLRVVGIDPWQPALAIARENVRMEGLHTWIELREQVVQELSDTEVFDLAFIPGFFIAEAVIRTALERVCRALRAGGWISCSEPKSLAPTPSPRHWRGCERFSGAAIQGLRERPRRS